MHTFTCFLPRRAVTFIASILNAAVILESFQHGESMIVETPWGTMSIAPCLCAEEIAAALTEHRFAADCILIDTAISA